MEMTLYLNSNHDTEDCLSEAVREHIEDWLWEDIGGLPDSDAEAELKRLSVKVPTPTDIRGTIKLALDPGHFLVDYLYHGFNVHFENARVA